MACDPWPVTWCCPIDTQSAAVTGAAISAATDILWAFSGRQFGLCTVTVRPCRQSCLPVEAQHVFFGDTWPNPMLLDGGWVNLGCGTCRGSCGCTEVSEVVFSDRVEDIIEIQVDSEVLPTGGAYRLDNHRRLVRLGGEQWPTCQDWNVDNGEVGSWSVTMTIGTPVPAAGQVAVSELATEILLAMCSSSDCRLPKRVQEITRNGVTVAMLDAMEYLKEGRSGLFLVDAFLQAFNPSRLQAPSAVYSVDRMPQDRYV